MPRIVKEPEERRKEILETALRLFYEKGYEKTSISEIAQEMHVAQGLCYRYFPSKEALFDTAIDGYAEQLAGRMTAFLQEPELTIAQIVERMPTFLETENDDGYAYKLSHGREGQKIHQRLSMSICEKLVPVVKTQLDLARERGEIALDDTETAASFCVYGQLGLLLDTNLPGEERVRRIKTFLLAFLQANANR